MKVGRLMWLVLVAAARFSARGPWHGCDGRLDTRRSGRNGRGVGVAPVRTRLERSDEPTAHRPPSSKITSFGNHTLMQLAA